MRRFHQENERLGQLRNQIRQNYARIKELSHWNRYLGDRLIDEYNLMEEHRVSYYLFIANFQFIKFKVNPRSESHDSTVAPGGCECHHRVGHSNGLHESAPKCGRTQSDILQGHSALLEFEGPKLKIFDTIVHFERGI